LYPEDRVLVGVIKRKRDLTAAFDEHWYRIPQGQLSRGINAEYVALFLSGSVFKGQSGGIHYYARITGLELLYRRDLLPKEADHPRAGDIYYKIALGELQPKQPPILNPAHRVIAFIHTTWDRFVQANTISDLYSKSDYFVDRIYHALRTEGFQPEHFWETEAKNYPFAPGVRILCENGAIIASTVKSSDHFYLDDTGREDAILKAIIEEIRRRGGPATINIPMDGD